MKLIGLTGGVGMGKSTAANLLRELGLPLVDTDDLAREVVAPGEPALDEIHKTFGDVVMDASGRLKREVLAGIVFASESRRRELEAITHPRIRQRWEAQAAAWKASGAPFGVVVIPLLYETHAETAFDSVVCVACSQTTQSQRLALRGWSPEEGQRRIAAQWPAEKKMQLARFVIWTEGDVASHRSQWERVMITLRASDAASRSPQTNG